MVQLNILNFGVFLLCCNVKYWRETKFCISVLHYLNHIIPTVLAIPTSPTIIQNKFNVEYALSFFNKAHHDNRIASRVLNIQTNRKGLLGPCQLTREKLKILIKTPVISSDFTWRRISKFS